MDWISDNLKLTGGVVLVAAVALFAMRGCGGYAEVSQKTYDFAQSLLQTTMRRDDPRTGRTRAQGVAAVQKQMAAAMDAGEITAAEVTILNDIIELTKADQWDEARKELRDLLEAQIE